MVITDILAPTDIQTITDFPATTDFLATTGIPAITDIQAMARVREIMEIRAMTEIRPTTAVRALRVEPDWVFFFFSFFFFLFSLLSFVFFFFFPSFTLFSFSGCYMGGWCMGGEENQQTHLLADVVPSEPSQDDVRNALARGCCMGGSCVNDWRRDSSPRGCCTF